jgi:hypothetical protein
MRIVLSPKEWDKARDRVFEFVDAAFLPEGGEDAVFYASRIMDEVYYLPIRKFYQVRDQFGLVPARNGHLCGPGTGME